MVSLNEADLLALAKIIQGLNAPQQTSQDRGGGESGQGIKKEMIKHIQEFDGEKDKYENWALRTMMVINTVEEKLAGIL